MSDENLLRVIIAALGGLWIAWIVWSHQRKRVQGERLHASTSRARSAGRREPSIDPATDAGDELASTSRLSDAVEAMEYARRQGRADAPFDADLAAELEKLQQEIAGDAPVSPSAPTAGVAARAPNASRPRVEPTFGRAPEAAATGREGSATPFVQHEFGVSPTSARSHFGARGEGVYDRLVTLFVVAAPAEEISGFELVVATEKCGLEFGAMDVYHRLVDGRPEAGPVFSVANMTKPGSFDLSRITELSTPGLTFFMTLPGPMRALDAWDTMLPTAQRMAELLGAQVLDEEHNALGRQRIQHIRDDLRAYDRTLERQTIKRPW